MKIQRKVSPTTIIEAEGKSVQELFEALAALEGVFVGHETCGCCGKTGVTYQCQRDRDGNAYHKAVCLACGAQFRFGVRRDGGGLFPQLKDQDGNAKPNGGWAKWEGHQDQPTQTNHGRRY